MPLRPALTANTPKPSNDPSHVGKGPVRFKLPDTPDDTVIYLDPFPDFEGEAMMTFKRRRGWHALDKTKYKPTDAATGTNSRAGGTGGALTAKTDSTLFRYAESPHLSSITAADNKSLSKHKEGVGAAAVKQQDFISPQLGGPNFKPDFKCPLWIVRDVPESTTRERRWRRHERSLEVRKVRCLETACDEHPRNSPNVHVTTARDSYGHHAHAYRPCHEAYEADSERKSDRYVDDIMSDSSTRSAIGVPIDVDVEGEDPFASLFVIESDGCDCSDTNDILRSFVMDKKNIILDSLCPEIAPHIVISPPSNPWEGGWAYSWNSPLPQCDYLLQVPSLYHGMALCVPSYSKLEEYSCCALEPPSSSHAPATSTLPLKDSESALQTIVRTRALTPRSQSAFDTDSTHLSSYRRLFKIAAIHASVAAKTFRVRWDSPQFCEGNDKPFLWSDPAIPFLALYGQCHDVRIFDSVNPFCAPHIVIHEVPDQHPLEACENRTIVPQHCGFLMVPGAPCPCHSGYTTEDTEYTADVVDDEVDTDSDGTSPTEESDSESCFDCLESPQEGLFEFISPSLPFKLQHEFILEEDEDELPPFDDWYQDIARRMT